MLKNSRDVIVTFQFSHCFVLDKADEYTALQSPYIRMPNSNHLHMFRKLDLAMSYE